MTTRVTRNLLTPDLRSGISLPTVADFDAIKTDAAFAVGDCVTVAGRIMRKISTGWIDVTPADMAAFALANTEGGVSYANLPRVPARSVLGNPQTHNDVAAFIGRQGLLEMLGFSWFGETESGGFNIPESGNDPPSPTAVRVGRDTSSASGVKTVTFFEPFQSSLPGVVVTPHGAAGKCYGFNVSARTISGFDVEIFEIGAGSVTRVAVDFTYHAIGNGA